MWIAVSRKEIQLSIRKNVLMVRCPEIARTALRAAAPSPLDLCKHRAGLSDLSGPLLVLRIRFSDWLTLALSRCGQNSGNMALAPLVPLLRLPFVSVKVMVSGPQGLGLQTGWVVIPHTSSLFSASLNVRLRPRTSSRT